LFERGLARESDDSRFIFIRAEDSVNEGTRCGLFDGQRSLFGDTGVNQDGERKRQISLARESENLLRLAVLRHANVFLFERRDKTPLLVNSREKNVG
jgi:hypothetical protein